MLVRVSHVYVDGLTYEDFWLVDPRNDSSQRSGFDVLSVFLAGGVEGSFVSLESVPSAFVKLRNVYIGLFEGMKRSSKVSVVDAGSHADAMWVVASVDGFGVEIIDHIKLP